MKDSRKRYIGLGVHKHYLIALGVDEELNIVLPARRVELARLEAWMKKTLAPLPLTFKEYASPRGLDASFATVGTLFVGFHVETLPSRMTT